MTTVLVVNGSAADRRLVSNLLQGGLAVEVQYAADGDEALAMIDLAPPDLVISGVKMPKMDGLQLVATIRARYPLVPVILMTSRGTDELAVQALQAGAASYVPRRKLAQQLVPTVRQVITVAQGRRSHVRLMGCIVHSQYSFVLNNDCSLFGPLVAYLQEGAAQMGLADAADRTRLGVALEEALDNALYHGNLGVSSSLKERNEAIYQAMVERRRGELPYCQRQIHVRVEFSREQAVFVIRDEGDGFDPTSLPDPTEPANLEKTCGRGILLMRTFMDEITYSDCGNEVTLVKRHPRGNGSC